MHASGRRERLEWMQAEDKVPKRGGGRGMVRRGGADDEGTSQGNHPDS